MRENLNKKKHLVGAKSLGLGPVGQEQFVPEAGFARAPEAGFARAPEAGFARAPEAGFARAPEAGFSRAPRPELEK